MCNLTPAEKRRLENLLGMGSGYVLDFTNRTFSEFVMDSTGRDIYDVRYQYGSGSKANVLRGFWNAESNSVVSKLLSDLLDYVSEGPCNENRTLAVQACRKIVARIKESMPVADIDALRAADDEKDFEIV